MFKNGHVKLKFVRFWTNFAKLKGIQNYCEKMQYF